MEVGKNRVVFFHYRLYEGETLLEDSRDGDPVAHLYGRGGLLTGLEKEMEGKTGGEVFEVTLPPEQAYGIRREGAIERVPVKYLMQKSKPRVGQVVQVNTDSGPRDVVVLKVGRFNVDIDTNHPLAGKTLRFEIEIGKIREATEEEMSHGHAHGPGGHHH